MTENADRTDAVMSGTITSAVFGSSLATFEQKCGVAAPLVVNGGVFVGCQLPADHDGNHEVKVGWAA